MAEDRKEYYKLKNKLEQKIYRQANNQTLMLEKLGFKEGPNSEKKLTFRHSAINKKQENHINIGDSLHAKGVQRSQYLQIDDDMMQEIENNPVKVRQMNQNLVTKT